jgi:galactonate dehydratase
MDAFRTNWAFIKVETDEGLYGWGRGHAGHTGAALEGCVADFRRLVVGRDAQQIEKLCFEVYRDCYWKGGPVMMSALSGIEIALWDIAGKFYDTPVYNLMGGQMRDRVKMYANAWFTGAREPADFAAAALKVKALGIRP